MNGIADQRNRIISYIRLGIGMAMEGIILALTDGSAYGIIDDRMDVYMPDIDTIAISSRQQRIAYFAVCADIFVGLIPIERLACAQIDVMMDTFLRQNGQLQLVHRVTPILRSIGGRNIVSRTVLRSALKHERLPFADGIFGQQVISRIDG